MRLLLSLLLFPTIVAAAERPDILIADFEGDTYGDWKTTGTAFGKGPAKGTLPGQMHVDGFLGKGLVNSFNGGDPSTGSLTSPEFTIDRKFINFLLGGGKHEKLSINLLVDGKVARTATGPNDKPGGSEHLDWHSWDVADLEGKKSTIQIIDEATGGWGHINIDHIVQSDRKKATEPASRTMTIDKRYLHLPVKNGAPKRVIRFDVDGKMVREFDIELAEDKSDFLVFADVSAFKNKKLTITAKLPADSKAFDAIVASDEVPDKDGLYKEKLRPQFHFTSRRGWLNDPNGLVFDGKSYHLFYQHNPFGREWGNMHWGHATSPDLVHWTEHGDALYPKSMGDMAFSGSAVLDKDNTSGWGTKADPPLVLAFTSTGRGECIAYSTDKGMTWIEYEKNPVVKHAGRDPKLVWYAPRKHWVMAVYDEAGGKKGIAFHTSPDLKSWTFQSKIDDFYECPDLFELGINAKDASKWILYGADGKYLIGSFDGKKFTKESDKRQLWHGNFYAAQTFDNAELGQRVQIGWGQGITFRDMPFNQQMTLPVVLTLRQSGDEIRMEANPVDSLLELRGKASSRSEIQLTQDAKTVVEKVDLVELDISVVPAAKGSIHLSIRGLDVVYDSSKGQLTCGKVSAHVEPFSNGKLRLNCFVDRGSIEIFTSNGATAISVAHVAHANSPTLTLAGVGTADVAWWPLKSAWK